MLLDFNRIEVTARFGRLMSNLIISGSVCQTFFLEKIEKFLPEIFCKALLQLAIQLYNGIMNVAIVGSREFEDYAYMRSILKCYLELGVIEKVVSGGARGADTLAKRYAKDNNIPYKEFPAEWTKNGVYDKAAGVKRNIKIVDSSDMVIAFRVKGEANKGTNHTIRIAEEKGKDVVIIDCDNDDRIG